MRVEMVTANLSTPGKREDRKGAMAIATSECDNAVEPGKVLDPAVKSVTAPRFEPADAVDDSLSSSEPKSVDADLTTMPGKKTDSSSVDSSAGGSDSNCTTTASLSTLRDRSCEGQTRGIIDRNGKKADPCKQKMKSTVVKGKRVLGHDENHDVNDERSMLMALAQAAAIPSDDSFSEESEDDKIQDERSRVMALALAASIPDSDDSFDNDDSEMTQLMAEALAASIPDSDDDSFDNDYSERTTLMVGSQAASIPSDESFRHIGVSSSRIRQQLPSIVLGTDARSLTDSEELESDDSASSFLTAGSGRTSTGDESEIDMKVQSDGTAISAMDYRLRISSRTSALAGDDVSNKTEESDRGRDSRKKSKKKAGGKFRNSRSFSGISNSFNWSNVKTKIFYSFKALKASSGSSSDGSRTVFVKNLAREVTYDHLKQFFQDSGRIVDIRIVRDPQSGLAKGYVEFESGTSARHALRKSGKKLEGRVILCDIAYENSKGTRSLPDSGHGVLKRRSEFLESGLRSTHSRVIETQAALKLFDPELREGDAKFLSRFSDDPLSSYREIQASLGQQEAVNSHLRQPTRGENREGSTRQGQFASGANPYEESLISGKTEAELEQSVYFDAESLSRQSSIAAPPVVLQRPRKPRKSVMRMFWPWKRLRWQWWQIASRSSKWAARRKASTSRRSKTINTNQNSTQESSKMSRALNDSKSSTSQESSKRPKSDDSKRRTSRESVKLYCSFS